MNSDVLNPEYENGYVKINVNDGDRISLKLFKDFKSDTSSDGGVYYTYGPFVMSLKIKEKMGNR